MKTRILPGGINYLNRSCEEEKLDSVIFSGYFITYLRSCRSNLCNSGDGVQSKNFRRATATEE